MCVCACTLSHILKIHGIIKGKKPEACKKFQKNIIIVKEERKEKTTPRLIYNIDNCTVHMNATFIGENKIYFLCVFLIFCLSFSLYIINDLQYPSRVYVHDF